jgi:hypothetical protein
VLFFLTPVITAHGDKKGWFNLWLAIAAFSSIIITNVVFKEITDWRSDIIMVSIMVNLIGIPLNIMYRRRLKKHGIKDPVNEIYS